MSAVLYIYIFKIAIIRENIFQYRHLPLIYFAMILVIGECDKFSSINQPMVTFVVLFMMIWTGKKPLTVILTVDGYI